VTAYLPPKYALDHSTHFDVESDVGAILHWESPQLWVQSTCIGVALSVSGFIRLNCSWNSIGSILLGALGYKGVGNELPSKQDVLTLKDMTHLSSIAASAFLCSQNMLPLNGNGFSPNFTSKIFPIKRDMPVRQKMLCHGKH